MSEAVGFAAQLRRIVREPHLPRLTPTDDDDAVADFVLRERKARMSFRITGVPASATAVKIDRLGHLKGMRDGRWKRNCDYLMVIPAGDGWCSILIEMKKTLSEENRAKEQLIRTIPVFEYLKSLCEIETQQSWEIVTRYVVIAERASARLAKDRIRVNSGAQSYQHEEYKGIQIGFFVGDSLAAKTLMAV